MTTSGALPHENEKLVSDHAPGGAVEGSSASAKFPVESDPLLAMPLMWPQKGVSHLMEHRIPLLLSGGVEKNRTTKGDNLSPVVASPGAGFCPIERNIPVRKTVFSEFLPSQGGHVMFRPQERRGWVSHGYSPRIFFSRDSMIESILLI